MLLFRGVMLSLFGLFLLLSLGRLVLTSFRCVPVVFLAAGRVAALVFLVLSCGILLHRPGPVFFLGPVRLLQGEPAQKEQGYHGFPFLASLASIDNPGDLPTLRISAIYHGVVAHGSVVGRSGCDAGFGGKVAVRIDLAG